MANGLKIADIGSYDVKIFPSSRRDTTYDRNAIVPTENNLTSLINRLTLPSFVIEGLNISDDGKKLRAGMCSIAGILFCFKEDLRLDDSTTAINEGDYLVFRIRVKSSTIGKEYDNLVPCTTTDSNYVVNAILDSGDKFSGIALEAYSSLREEVNHFFSLNTTSLRIAGADFYDYYLPVSIYTDGKWTTLKNVDETGNKRGTGKQANLMKFKSSEVKLNFDRFNNVNFIRNEPTSAYLESQDLETYLKYNIIIDGGEV